MRRRPPRLTRTDTLVPDTTLFRSVTATNVQWHPSGRYLAVNLNTLNQVAFFQVDEAADGKLALRAWGEPVAVGADPFVGRFTPDGRYYLTADWGRDFSATTLDGRVPARDRKSTRLNSSH